MTGDPSPGDIPIPSPPPRLNVRDLWLCLLLPQVGAALLVLVLFSTSSVGPPNLIFLAILGLLGLGGFTRRFVKICRVRYQGRSLVLMSIGYVLGQLILTAAILIGTCFILIMQL